MAHILVVGWGNVTKRFPLLLSPNAAMLTDHRRCLLGEIMSSSCSVSTSSLFLLDETPRAFHCNRTVKSVWTISLDKKELTESILGSLSIN